MKFLDAEYTPYPQLRLEYIPGGSLDEQESISAFESVSILCQCLSALTYLHGHNPPIVHRDIKPENILVQHRDSDVIRVKFGDFGLSKDYNNLSTCCGSPPYVAPDIYQNKQYKASGGDMRVTYNAAIDVWSLSVVMYKLLRPLPRYRDDYWNGGGTTWCAKVVEEFQKDCKERPDRLKEFLLAAMVVISPSQRWTAQACYRQALALLGNTEARHEIPSEDSYSEQAVRYRPASGPSTALGRQGSSNGALTDTGRYARSGAPPRSLQTSSSLNNEERAASPDSNIPQDAAARDRPGDNTGGIECLHPGRFPPLIKRDDYSLAKNAQDPPHPQALENLEASSSYSLESLAPCDQPVDSDVCDPSQIDQDAWNAATLLQEMSQAAYKSEFRLA